MHREGFCSECYPQISQESFNERKVKKKKEQSFNEFCNYYHLMQKICSSACNNLGHGPVLQSLKIILIVDHTVQRWR